MRLFQFYLRLRIRPSQALGRMTGHIVKLTPIGVFAITAAAGTLAFIVPDHRRNEFASSQAVKSISGLKIGVPYLADYFLIESKAICPRPKLSQ